MVTHVAIGGILVHLGKYEILPHTNNYFGKVIITSFNFPICKIGEMTLPYLPHMTCTEAEMRECIFLYSINIY